MRRMGCSARSGRGGYDIRRMLLRMNLESTVAMGRILLSRSLLAECGYGGVSNVCDVALTS